MADFNSLVNEGSDDGFHEIQLSGKQLVFLFMATTVVSVVIFLCGVLVGRGVRAERAAEADAAVAALPAPTDTVAEAGPAAGPVAAEPPTPPAESAEPETPVDPSPTPADTRPQEAPAPAPAPVAASPEARPAPTSDVRPRANARPSPPASEVRQRAARPPAASPRGTWVVQIAALRDRAAASSLVQRLNGKGYPAFVVNPTAGAPAPVFKVQVGRFADQQEAEQVARRLEKEEQFKPWVSR